MLHEKNMKLILIRVPILLKEEIDSLIPSCYSNFTEFVRTSMRLVLIANTCTLKKLGILLEKAREESKLETEQDKEKFRYDL